MELPNLGIDYYLKHLENYQLRSNQNPFLSIAGLSEVEILTIVKKWKPLHTMGL